MSIKTLAGISAAAILSILAGNAYGELAENLKATKSNGCETANNVSTILGGSNICGGFASFVPVLTRGENNSAATLGANGSSYGDGALFATHQSDWSSLVAVKLSATENTIIWSTGRYHVAPNTGLALIQKDSSTVALVKWTQTSFTEIVSATVSGDKYHTILVTHKYTAAETEEGSAQSTYTIYVDGTATESTTASCDAYTDLDDSGFQYGSVHGSLPTGLNNTAGILMDEAGVWTSKCLTSEEAATVAGEFVYADIVTHTINLTQDKNWSAIKPESIGENDVVEIITANKTITFDEAAAIPCPVIVRGGILRIVNPQNLSITKTMTVIGGATLRIDANGVDLTTPISFAKELTIQGGLEIQNIGSTAGTTRDHAKDNKRNLGQDIVFDGGSFSLGDGSLYFSGKVSVAAGKTASMTTGWSKAWIFDSLTVPETSTLNFTNGISSDRNESILDILGGEVAGTLNLTATSSSTGTLGFFPTSGVCSAAKVNLKGLVTAYVGGTAEEPTVYTGNWTAANAKNTISGNATLSAQGTMFDTDSGVTITGGKTTIGRTSGDRFLKGNITIASGATLVVSRNDAINYDGTTSMTINGTLDCGATRQSFGNNNTIALGNGGNIIGTGALYSDESYTAVIDVFGSPTFTVNGEAQINAPVASRRNKTLTIAKAEGATTAKLSVKTQAVGNGQIVYDGLTQIKDISANMAPSASKKMTLKDSAGYFATGALDATVTIDGTFTINDGYSYPKSAVTSVTKLVGVEGASIGKNTGTTPRIEVKDHSEWSGTIADDTKALVILSVAKIEGETTTYYYTLADAITAATDDALDTIIVIDPTAALPEGYEIVEGNIVKKQSTGPTEISQITEDNVLSVVPSTIQTADATKLAAWITETSEIETIDGLSAINVNCFLMGVANSSTDPELKITAEDLEKILAATDLAAAADALQSKYPNAEITVEDVTESICGEGVTNTHLYQLKLSLPTAQD